MAKKSTNKWYHPKVHTGWDKNMTILGRRRKVIMAHKGNYLSAGRAMLALSNVTKDSATARKSRADANYFFKKHQETGK